MPLSENEIKNLLSLDDERLRQIISQITEAVGGDRRKVAAITADIPSLREKLSGMSANDVNRLLDKAGRDRSEQILDELRKS